MALVMGAAPVQADPARRSGKSETCAAAYKSAQEREQSGHLVDASRLLVKCASEACGTALSQECVTRGSQLSLVLPTVVVLVADSAGEPLVDVQVKMDGEPLTSHLNGLGLPVDPGTHEFAFKVAGKVFAPQKITIAKGEHNRQVSVSEQAVNDPNAPLSTTEH